MSLEDSVQFASEPRPKPIQGVEVGLPQFDTLPRFFAEPTIKNILDQLEIEERKAYYENTAKFELMVANQRSLRRSDLFGSRLFGETLESSRHSVLTPDKVTSDYGAKINMDFVAEQGIDAKYVLMFRFTQPSLRPKPELFWTSDFYEARDELQNEISHAERKSGVLLVATLDQIASNGGLIEDKNDDSGISVRQIDNTVFDPANCIAVIK